MLAANPPATPALEPAPPTPSGPPIASALHVAVHTPLHAGLSGTAGGLLTYLPPSAEAHASALLPGTLVRVPLGKRSMVGVVWDPPPTPAATPFPAAASAETGQQQPAPPQRAVQLRAIEGVLPGLTPLDAGWRKLIAFTAHYYQRSIGEVATLALPPGLRTLTDAQLARRLRPSRPKAAASATTPHATACSVPVPGDGGTPCPAHGHHAIHEVAPRDEAASEHGAHGANAPAAFHIPAPVPPHTPAPTPIDLTGAVTAAHTAPTTLPDLTPEQQAACNAIAARPGPFLLHGTTGSGKTEVYLRAVQHALQSDPQAQALVLVPEINLTPQLLERFQGRFAPLFGEQAIAVLHSRLTDAQRLRHWLAAHTGRARILLGTRMAILASLPHLRIVVVDEEHDPSYKQDEGARYHARDLALWRGHDLGVKVILGSATPSLESWHASDPAVGRYQRLCMPSRIGQGSLPAVRVVDMRQQPRRVGGGAAAALSPPLVAAIGERIRRGEQSLLLLNRRGYAPVLLCPDCGWKSDCPHCSAHQVFHKTDRTLRCHHCGDTRRVPRTCPGCGNPDILPLGHGTQQVQEELEHALASVRRPDGQPPRIARMDADTTRLQGSLQAQLGAVHDGAVDVLVGTQMIAKGHDFRHITLVAAVQPDHALFSSDFRAPERLFALLMQAAGRAGRDASYIAAQSTRPEMWLQTQVPEHALYAALRQHDYHAFATQQLRERQESGTPPFVHQALLRADATTQDAAQHYLHAAVEAARQAALPHLEDIFLTPPIPLAMQRVAGVERAHMLIEATDRRALRRFLHAWQPWLHWLRGQPQHKSLRRWLMDIDPQTL